MARWLSPALFCCCIIRPCLVPSLSHHAYTIITINNIYTIAQHHHTNNNNTSFCTSASLHLCISASLYLCTSASLHLYISTSVSLYPYIPLSLYLYIYIYNQRRYKWSYGATYGGHWRKGVQDGYGIEKFASGNKFEGE